MKTYNEAPYYDDFDEEKGYYQILFKPGLAVQARELTQLQTIIRNQIRRFGDHIFEDGSIVYGGQTSIFTSYFLTTNEFDLNLETQTTITGQTSGARGKVSKTQFVNGNLRIYFSYLGSEVFIPNETVITDLGTTFQIPSGGSIGISKRFGIEKSIFFIKGSFVYCEPHDISIDGQLNTVIGLNVTEDVFTHREDETLLDNARGYSNYTARGADRFTISLDLASYAYNPSTEEFVDGIDIENFIELSRLRDGKTVKKITNATYSEIGDEMARRTYDESGDYTVKPFLVKVIPNVDGDEDKLSLKVFPGKAYVKGYEFESIAPTYIDLPKARETDETTGVFASVEYGSFLYVNGITGYIDYNGNVEIEISADVASPIVGSPEEEYETVAKANVYAIEKVSSLSDVYKLFLFNVRFQNGYNNFSSAVHLGTANGSWSAGIYFDSYDENPVSLISSPSRSNIIPLLHDNIKTFYTTNNGNDTDTQFLASKTFTGINFSPESGTSTAIIASGAANQQFFTNNPNDWMVVDPSTDTYYDILSISGSGSSKTVVIDSAIGVIGASVITKMAYVAAQERTKTLNTDGSITGINITTDEISLEKSDCYRLIAVEARNSSTSETLDVSNLFTFNNGQRIDLYDHGYVKLKAGKTIPARYDVLDIYFSYFTHSSTDGFFSPDSYGDIDYSDIPAFVSSKGERFRLNSCLDFRPVRENGGTTINGTGKVYPESSISADYSFYLSRADKLVLSKERRFKLIKGIPAITPEMPSDEIDSMTLYRISIPAYTRDENSVSYTYVDNRRYTMRDIGAIDRRVRKIEYYTALSYLEKQAKDEAIESSVPGIERFKNGILVDPFVGHGIGNPGNPDYSCSIDKSKAKLRPRFSSYSHRYLLDQISGNAVKESDLVFLDYEEVPLLTQNQVTSWVNCNPYMVFEWVGDIELNPSTDNWVETRVLPDVIANVNGENDAYTIINQDSENTNSTGVLWDDWRQVVKGAIIDIEDDYESNNNLSTIFDPETGETKLVSEIEVTNEQTITTSDVNIRTGVEILNSEVRTIKTDTGVRVVDTSIVPYIRPQILKFSASKLKPGTQLFASFDDLDVTRYCDPAVEIVLDETLLNASSDYYTKAIRVRKANDISIAGDVLFAKGGRAFIQLDAESPSNFSIGDSLEWLADGLSSVWESFNYIIEINYPNENNALIVNPNGDVAGFFRIPDPTVAGNPKFRTGEILFRLSDSLGKNGTTAAETKYVAQGLSQSTERTYLATKVKNSTVRPITETETSTTTDTKDIVVIDPDDGRSEVILPPSKPVDTVIGCDESVGGNGFKGTFEYTLNFGEGVGTYGIGLNIANGVPILFKIIFNGREVANSGWIGDSSYDDQMIANGYPSISYNSAPTQLLFEKNISEITRAKLIVETPIAGSDWIAVGVCQEYIEPDPTYSISADKNFIDEGERVTFTSLTTNVDPGTTLYWKISDSSTVDSADIGSTSGSFSVNSSGRNELPIDVNEGDNIVVAETLQIELYTNSSYSGNPVASSETVVISPLGGPIYKIVPDKTSINEGETVTFTVSTTNVATGTIVYWKLSSDSTVDSNDINGPVQGSFSIDSSGGHQFSIETIDGANLTVVEFLEVELYDNSSYSGNALTVSQTVDVLPIGNTDPVYTITVDKDLIFEGESVTFTISVENVVSGRNIEWGGGIGTNQIDDDDLDGTGGESSVSGNFTTTSASEYTLTFKIKEGDNITSNEYLRLTLYDRTDGIDYIGKSPIVTVQPILPRYSIRRIGNDRIYEGDHIDYRVVTENLEVGDSLNWEITGTVPSERISGSFTGSVTLEQHPDFANRQIANFRIQTVEDAQNEKNPDYTIKLLLREPGSTAIVAETAFDTIYDKYEKPPERELVFDVQVGNGWLQKTYFLPWPPLIMFTSRYIDIVRIKITGASADTNYRISRVQSYNPQYKFTTEYPGFRFSPGGLSEPYRETPFGKVRSATPINFIEYGPGEDPDLGSLRPSSPSIRLQNPDSIGSSDLDLSNDDRFIGDNRKVFGSEEHIITFPSINVFFVPNNFKIADDPSVVDIILENGGLPADYQSRLNPKTSFNTGFTIAVTFTKISGSRGPEEKVATDDAYYKFSSAGLRIDPIAQSFFIDVSEHPNGVFVKSVDLFFRSKSSSGVPIQMQIRPMVNGYPSSDTILPYAIVTKSPSEINVSTDASVPTRFEFPVPIHLQPGEYSIVMPTDTDEYELYTAIIGDFDLNNPERRITEQPMLGSMFKSQNASTWTAVQEEDLKFVVNRCDFDTSGPATVDMRTDTSGMNGDVAYDVFFADGETVNFPTTSIDYYYNLENSGYLPYQLGSNVSLNQTRVLRSSNGNDAMFRAILASSDSKVSPILDINRLSNVLVKNIINNDATGEEEPFGGNARARYITRTVKLAQDFESTDITVYLDARKPVGTDIKVYYKVSNIDDPFFGDNVYHEMILDAAYSAKASGDYIEYRYKTPYGYDPIIATDSTALPDGSKFDSFAIKIVMLSDNSVKIPEIKNLRAIALDE